jgi:hypothetical protein
VAATPRARKAPTGHNCTVAAHPDRQREEPYTAFPHHEAGLKETLAGARLDRPSFARPLSRCRIESCRGMCCYDGVYVDESTAEVLRRVAREEAPFFRDLGLSLPPEVIVQGEWEGLVSGLKTAVVPRPFSAEVDGFPAHFEDTACVFLLPDGRCSLQALSLARGRHPWYYKPSTCWLHPITIEPATDDAGPTVRLESEATDPYRQADYPGYAPQTFCGRFGPAGRPGSEVLAPELAFLGAIAGRDFLAELAELVGSASSGELGAPQSGAAPTARWEGAAAPAPEPGPGG